MDHEDAGALCDSVLDAISTAVIADRDFLATTMTGILARGHVLLEDVPGTGKTLTARSFARALGLDFQRIQFTPDLLPSDITGSNIYSEATGEFEFSPGPVFSNVVLADEINRAPPKTQAALLEAMGEKQVTVDGQTHQLPEPFFVIATQNPVEQEGTFGLPEAQRDRFTIKTAMGYPSAEGERRLLDRRARRVEQTPTVEAVIDGTRVPQLQRMPEHVTVDERLRDYMVALGRRTRADDRVEVGVSPRGIQRLFEAARAAATLAGREYVVPDDIKSVVEPVFTHRIVLTADASVRGTSRSAVLADVLGSIRVPAVEGEATGSASRDDAEPEPTPETRTDGADPNPRQTDTEYGSERADANSARDSGPNQPD